MKVLILNGSPRVGGNTAVALEAVKALIEGRLDYDPEVMCDHHGEGHECGDHHSGGQHCGGHCGN